MQEHEKTVRIPLRLPFKLYSVLVRVTEKQRTKMEPFVRELIHGKLTAPAPDDFCKATNPFASESEVRQISVDLPESWHKAFRKRAIDANTDMTKLIIAWLIKDPSINAALRSRKWI